MPRVLIGSIADRRVSISRAALFVKVTARTPAGLAWPVWIRCAMRVVRTFVLPLPAPARISAHSRGRVTAWSCCGLRFWRYEADIGLIWGRETPFSTIPRAPGRAEFPSMRGRSEHPRRHLAQREVGHAQAERDLVFVRRAGGGRPKKKGR